MVTFGGFKFGLSYKSEKMSIDTEVRIKKIKSSEFQQFTIIKKDSEGNEILPQPRGEFGSRKDIRYFVKTPTGEVEISPFERTKTIQVAGFMPMQDKEQFKAEGHYNMTGQPATLYRIAQELGESKQMAVSKFTFGNGFKMYVALIYPVFRDNQFGLIMALSDGKMEYEFMPTNAQETPAERKLPTLADLAKEYGNLLQGEKPIMVAGEKSIIVA
jgi:hypothetical protein